MAAEEHTPGGQGSPGPSGQLQFQTKSITELFRLEETSKTIGSNCQPDTTMATKSFVQPPGANFFLSSCSDQSASCAHLLTPKDLLPITHPVPSQTYLGEAQTHSLLTGSCEVGSAQPGA